MFNPVASICNVKEIPFNVSNGNYRVKVTTLRFWCNWIVFFFGQFVVRRYAMQDIKYTTFYYGSCRIRYASFVQSQLDFFWNLYITKTQIKLCVLILVISIRYMLDTDDNFIYFSFSIYLCAYMYTFEFTMASCVMFTAVICTKSFRKRTSKFTVAASHIRHSDVITATADVLEPHPDSKDPRIDID